MSEEIATLLREVRDQQRLQSEWQAGALALPRRHFELYESQLGRVETINHRADAIQRRAGNAMKVVLWVVLWVALPLALLILATMLWPWLRYLGYHFA